MMDGLRISLFGRVRIAYGEETAVSLPPAVQTLAAYLVLNRHRCHRREVLADQFWGEYDESRARNCLSSTLWRLRRVLEPEGTPRGTYLLTTPTGDGEIGFNAASCYWLDVEAFEQCARPLIAHPTELTPKGAQELEQALQLYVDDLLGGMYQEWALRERERLRQIYLDSLACLMHYYRRVEGYERSVAFGKQILALEPLREDVHRAVIEAYRAGGQRALAVQQYEMCCEVLADELGIGPMEETQALYREIAMDRSGQTAVSHPTFDLDRYPSASLDHAMQQLSLAMRGLEQAQFQVQQAIKVVKQCIQSRQQPD